MRIPSLLEKVDACCATTARALQGYDARKYTVRRVGYSTTPLTWCSRPAGKVRTSAPIVGNTAMLIADVTLALDYGDASGKFVRDFVAAWTKVMNLDRFDPA